MPSSPSSANSLAGFIPFAMFLPNKPPTVPPIKAAPINGIKVWESSLLPSFWEDIKNSSGAYKAEVSAALPKNRFKKLVFDNVLNVPTGATIIGETKPPNPVASKLPFSTMSKSFKSASNLSNLTEVSFTLELLRNLHS